jgi:hypothetical protein
MTARHSAVYLLAIYSQKAIKNLKVLKSKAFKDFQ